MSEARSGQRGGDRPERGGDRPEKSRHGRPQIAPGAAGETAEAQERQPDSRKGDNRLMGYPEAVPPAGIAGLVARGAFFGWGEHGETLASPATSTVSNKTLFRRRLAPSVVLAAL